MMLPPERLGREHPARRARVLELLDHVAHERGPLSIDTRGRGMIARGTGAFTEEAGVGAERGRGIRRGVANKEDFSNPKSFLRIPWKAKFAVKRELARHRFQRACTSYIIGTTAVNS